MLKNISDYYQQELEPVEEFIENIKAGIADSFFLNLFAPNGFGKTSLLQRVWEKYEKQLPASLVEMKTFQNKQEAFNLSNLLIYIIQELEFRLPKRITSLPDDYEHSGDRVWLGELLVNLVVSATEVEKSILLLLDDYDMMPTEDSRWFEANVLSRLSQTRKVVVILTSKIELRFNERIDLRMRLETYEVRGLTVDIISRSFPRYEKSASEIYRITGGLPTLTGKFIQQLESSHVRTDADFRSHEQELVRKYYRTHVNEMIFQGMPTYKQETLLTLALLRRFDVTVLRGILPRVLSDHYQDYKTADYLDLLELLGSQVQWRIQGGYALKEALKVLLQGYAFIERPKLYKQVNRAAIILYRDELLKKEYRETYLIELLYHRLCLLRTGNNTNLSLIHAKIKDELQNFLNSENAALVSETDLDLLRNSLKRDSELKDYISEDTLLEIGKIIKTRLEEDRVTHLNKAKGGVG